MTNPPSPIKRYPLLPFSQLVYDSTRWLPSVYTFSRTVRISGGVNEKERWQKAVADALRNHPVFSAQTDRHGRQYPAQPKDILRGPYHKVSFRIEGKDLLITVQMSRILGDGRSISILTDDIHRAYNNQPLEQDDYWGYLEYVEQQKQTDYYRISCDWLMKEFADESIPVRPTTDTHLWTLLPPKAGLYMADYTDKKIAINKLSETEFLSLDGVISLCTAMAIAEFCGTDAGALTWAYEGRERLEEQRIFGSLHRDIPFKISNFKFQISNKKSDLIRQARNQIRFGIAHSNYPYTLTDPYTKRWNYAVNVLRVPDELDWQSLLPQAEFLPAPPQKFAYALLDVEIHESEKHLYLWFRYSATHYKDASIRRFASLVRKYAEWLLEDEK